MIKKIALVVFVFGMLSFSYGQEIKLMTYNIRYDNPNDGESAWPHRKEKLLNQIRFYEPDVLGTQEGKSHQIAFLDKRLSNYKYVGIGRGERKGKKPGEFTAIFYNTQKFKELKNGTFWLSETPNKMSKGWDASLNRICTYALLKDKKKGKKFWVFNTHFDHRGKTAKEKSAELIWSKIISMNEKKLPVFLMGDLNSQPADKPIQYLTKYMIDSRAVSQLPPFGPFATRCDFDACEPVERRIDYIFVSKNQINVKKYAVLANVDDVKYPSDHLPVYIEVKLKK